MSVIRRRMRCSPRRMLKILIADDSEVVRQLLKKALSGERGWSLCGEAVNGHQAVLLAHQLKPDLIVMDLAMPMLDGLRASSEILKFAPALPIVLYTLHNNPQIALEAKKAGIQAVVSKTDDMKVLVETMARIASEVEKMSAVATISNELFTAVAVPESTGGATQSDGAAAEAAEKAATGGAALAAPAAMGRSGDTTPLEVEPPSPKISEPPPDVS
jgi:CheY-like chemotaxis protein